MTNSSPVDRGRLKQTGHRVVRLEDFSDKEIELIKKAEVPSEFASLDTELEDWKP